MSFTYNGTEVQGVTYNGNEVKSITYNGVEVWSAHPPFLVRMRYDANEASHVKDISSRNYPITMYSGSNVPAAADPFGGNEAMNMDNVTFYIPASEAAIDGLVSTVTFWIKMHNVTSEQTFLYAKDYSYDSRRLGYWGGLGIGLATNNIDSTYDKVALSNKNPSQNTWHFVEISTQNALARIFLDGVLQKTEQRSRLNTYRYWKQPNERMYIGQFVGAYTDKLKADIYDLCILDGVWHTQNYNVPTAYI